MDVLSVIHGDNVRSGAFGEVVEERGHRLHEWSLAWGTPPPQPVDSYGAVLVLGGAMHAHEDERHPWLREENLFLQRLLQGGQPLFGVCLGAQLLAKAAHADVGPAAEPEVGWFPVELTDAGREDPVFRVLPERFDAFQWHYYTHGVPAGAVELAHSPVCTQGFRLGERVWGIQSHPEVTASIVDSWIAEEPEAVSEHLADETRERIGEWSELGRRLCGAFLGVAES